MLDVAGFVVVDGLLAITADPVGLVVLDLDVLILLGVDPELLGALLVLKADGVGVAGSPSRKSTMTSWPMRGMAWKPKFLPAQGWLTRTQQEDLSSFLP